MDIQMFVNWRYAHGAMERVCELNKATLGALSWRLNGIGEANFTLRSDDPINNLLWSWIQELQVWIDGELKWWGPLWVKNATPGQIEWKCEEVLSLLYKRFITTTSLEQTSIEQAEIAWALMQYAQEPQGSEGNGLLGVGIKDLAILKHPGFPDTGHNRSRIYERNEHKNIWELLEEFPTLEDGFDIGIELDPTGLRYFQAYYPTKGSYHPELILEYGRNIRDYKLESSSYDQANDIYATGGSNGEVRFEGHYTDDVWSTGYGLMTDVYSEGSTVDFDWLEGKAEHRSKRYKNPITSLEVQNLELPDNMLPVPLNFFGVVEVGDRLPVLIQDGETYFEGFVRVEEMVLDVNSEELSMGVSVIGTPSDDPVLVAAGVA